MDKAPESEELSFEPGPDTAPPEIKQAVQESYAVDLKPDAGMLF